MSEICDIPTHFDFLEVFRSVSMLRNKRYASERATDIVSAVIVSVKCGEIQTQLRKPRKNIPFPHAQFKDGRRAYVLQREKHFNPLLEIFRPGINYGGNFVLSDRTLLWKRKSAYLFWYVGCKLISKVERFFQYLRDLSRIKMNWFMQ